MKITGVEAIILRLPYITADVDGTQDDLVIQIETDEGVVGYGEVDSSPYPVKAIVDAEMSHGISYGLREILLGQNPLYIEQIWNAMYRQTSYYGRFGPAIHAMSGVDMALWDIAGKARGESIHRLMGGCYRKRVKAYASALMPETPKEARGLAQQFRASGFRAMKFGWGPIGRDLALDQKLFEAVREGAGDEADIMIDAGQRYTLKQAVNVAGILAELNTTWLEEPLDPDDLEGYARLSTLSPIPIAAGESESGFLAFRRLIVQGMIDIVQPDISRAGGFTEVRKIAHLAEVHKRRCIPHAFKSNILLAACLQFCAATEGADLLEYSMSKSPIRRNLTSTQLPVEDGYVAVPEGPGLGVEIDRETLAGLTHDSGETLSRDNQPPHQSLDHSLPLGERAKN